MLMSQHYHFAIASDWEYDWDFIRLLEQYTCEYKISTYLIWPHNLQETVGKVKCGEIKFSFLYDRASDTSSEFLELKNLIIQNNIPLFEKWQTLKWASDKAIMHFKFEENGIDTPYTIILPSFQTQENIALSANDLTRLGFPFITKPANTSGGGEGVIKETRILENVLQARQAFPAERYLLQEKIIPLEQDNRRFWFRGFYTCGLIQAVWWNDLTHVYEILAKEEVEKYHLHPLFEVVGQIAQVCKLNFFSTEIALDRRGKLITIDYVNEVCDMRLKSRHFNGVSDEIVERIAKRMVTYVMKKLFE
jgi:hypothetical protein